MKIKEIAILAKLATITPREKLGYIEQLRSGSFEVRLDAAEQLGPYLAEAVGLAPEMDGLLTPFQYLDSLHEAN